MDKRSEKHIRFIFPILISFLSLANICRAQQKLQNIVFEGAGIRGIAYCGALQALEEKGLLQQIDKVGGTSAGAITALCVSLGYTSHELADLLYATNFKKFNDGRFLFAGGINRVNKYFGWYRGEKFSKWIQKLIKDKTGNGEITFQELYARGFKDLYITATILNQQKLVILSRETYPLMRVCDAVRISISIPLYFEAVFVDADGKLVKRPRDKSAVDVMIDGGFTGNFPIRIFDSLSSTDGQEQILVNKNTLGFRIDSDDQIVQDSSGHALAPIPVNNFKQYLRAFYNMIIENLNRQPLTSEDWQRTISISDGKIGPRIRKLSKPEITVLIQNGYNATARYLQRK